MLLSLVILALSRSNGWYIAETDVSCMEVDDESLWYTIVQQSRLQKPFCLTVTPTTVHHLEESWITICIVFYNLAYILNLASLTESLLRGDYKCSNMNLTSLSPIVYSTNQRTPKSNARKKDSN